MGRQTKAELEAELAARDELLDEIKDAASDDSITSKEFRHQVLEILDEGEQNEDD